MALASRSLSQASPATRVPISSRLVETICMWLLKSCATPPVSCPSTSIFCAWRAMASASARRETSATPTTWLPSGMARRHTSSTLSPTRVSTAGCPGAGRAAASGAPGQCAVAAASCASVAGRLNSSAGSPVAASACSFHSCKPPAASNSIMPSRACATAAASSDCGAGGLRNSDRSLLGDAVMSLPRAGL